MLTSAVKAVNSGNFCSIQIACSRMIMAAWSTSPCGIAATSARMHLSRWQTRPGANGGGVHGCSRKVRGVHGGLGGGQSECKEEDRGNNSASKLLHNARICYAAQAQDDDDSRIIHSALSTSARTHARNHRASLSRGTADAHRKKQKSNKQRSETTTTQAAARVHELFLVGEATLAQLAQLAHRPEHLYAEFVVHLRALGRLEREILARERVLLLTKGSERGTEDRMSKSRQGKEGKEREVGTKFARTPRECVDDCR